MDGDNVKDICKYCRRDFDGSSKKGTTHLKNHTRDCRLKKVKVPASQLFLGKKASTEDPTIKLANHKFDPIVQRSLFAKMIAKHDYAFMMSEHEYFS